MSDNFKNFINHGDDPTMPINFELSSDEIKEQYDKLTKEEKILVFAKLNGYSFLPPTIERLYSDEYYLGGEHFFNHGDSIYPFWKDAFNNIFDDITTKKSYLILSGAIGIGKSTATRLCLSMTYARLLAMKNPSKTLGLAPKPMSAVIFHRSEETAEAEFVKWFNYDVMEYSPFFKNTHNSNLKFRVIASGVRGHGGLGTDIIFATMGEINFWDNQEKAQERLSSTLIRFKSRFTSDAIRKAGHFIVDSSAKGQQSVTEWFLDNTDPELTWNCKPAHYEVKPFDYKDSHGQTFDVFTGDSRYPAQILNKDRSNVDFTIDPDKIIHVPIQLLTEYKTNLEKSLQDLSGVSTGSSDAFFGGNIEHLMNCSVIKNKIPEVITVDFYNKEDKLLTKIQPMLDLVPFRTPIWLGLDLSAAKGGDCTGISAVRFDGWEVDPSGARLPKITCLFTFAIKNKSGQEISLFHVYQLIQELHKKYNIIVAADQAFSRQILQDCDRDGIKNTGRISTDLVPCEPAIYLKNLINRELIKVPFNKRLQREASDLYYTPKGKVDHPRKAGISKDFDNPDGQEKGSKDVWDSLAQACYALKLSIDEGEEYGYNGGFFKTMQAYDKLTKNSREETQKYFQNRLESLF